jgi:hypothetical protein
MYANLLELPLNATDFMRIVVGIVFGLVILGALASIVLNHANIFVSRLTGKPSPQDAFKERVRLAGGFATFMFALAVNEWLVSAAAIFIGGLLIAPEKFLLLLAAILRSDPKSTGSIASEITRMSSKEIQEKLDEDADDLDDNQPPSAPTASAPVESAPPSHLKSDEIRDRVRAIESKIFNLLKSKLSAGYTIEPYAAVKTPSRVLQYDAVITEKNTKQIRAAVEVKYQKAMSANHIRELLLRSERLLSEEYFVLFIVVFSSHSENSFESLIDLRYQFIHRNQNAGLSYFISKGSTIAPLNDDDIDRLV